MYEMTLDGATFFAPANEKYCFTQLELHEALNDAGYIDAMIPYTNPMYDKIEAMRSKIVLYKDNEPIFHGKVAEVVTNFDQQKILYIVGELSYLADTIQLQQNRNGVTKAQLLNLLLQAHNQQSEEKFYAGQVAVSGTIENGLIDFGYTLDIIKSHICEDDGYIKIVYRNGRREIDILPIEAYGKQSKQYIRFGSNLLDFSQTISGDSIVTAILPLGARQETSEVEGLDRYLDISSVNSGNKILVNQTAVKNFGYRCRVVHFETEDVNTLLRLSKAWLTTYQFAGLSLELTAVDLSMIDSSQDDYDVGDYVRCTAEPFNMDSWFPVRQKDTNILDLSQNKIVMGATRTASLTQATTGAYTSIQAQLPQQSSMLESARNNATELIVNATTGYVTTRNSEITIADNPDIAKAVKVWRWNMGGLGYSNTGYNGKYGTAITMDGAIVANFITAGEMSANRVRGGEFVVGGASTGKDGSIVGYTAAGKQVFKLDKNGLEVEGDLKASTITDHYGRRVTVSEVIFAAEQAARDAQNAADSAYQSLQSEVQASTSAASSATSAASSASAASVAQSAAETAKSAAETAKNAAADSASAAKADAAVAKAAADTVKKLMQYGTPEWKQLSVKTNTSGTGYDTHRFLISDQR